MTYPTDPRAIDLMIGFPFADKSATYDYLRKGLKDNESHDGTLEMPAEYMFKDTPDQASHDEDPIETTFTKMDRCGVAAGLFGLNERSIEAKRRHPDRVFFSLEVDPNDIVGAVRTVR
ncbi:MAG: amidohydrolase family protein, partial [Acidimicrobiales bacterium]